MSEENTATTETSNSSGWGVSGWFSGSSDPATTDSAALESSKEVGASDAELAQLEATLAATEQAVTSAIWSTFNAVTESLPIHTTSAADGNPTSTEPTAVDADLDDLVGPDESSKVEEQPANKTATAATTDTNEKGIEASNDEAEAAPASTSTSSFGLWSTLESAVENLHLDSTSIAAPASTLYDLYNSKVNQAAEWIQDLENKETEKDPLRRIKEHLSKYLEENPSGNYEEWIQLWTKDDDDWNHLSANDDETADVTIDPKFYHEGSPHRRIWNERNHQDGIDIQDENPLRNYVVSPTTEASRLPSKTKQSNMDDEEVITFEEVKDALPESPLQAEAENTDTATEDGPNKTEEH